MTPSIRYLYSGGQGEIEIKRSRFIATLAPVTSEDEAAAFIEQQKKRYWDARHNCSAFVIGSGAELTRCSDDGESPHTAGRPMLDILLAEELRDVCVVVTRYFGGILLGTGGLTRAYRDAVKEGLAHCTVAVRRQAVPVTIRADYTAGGKISYRIAEAGYPVTDTVYADDVTYSVLIPQEDCASFQSAVADASQGKAVWEASDPVWYSDIDGKIIIHENVTLL